LGAIGLPGPKGRLFDALSKVQGKLYHGTGTTFDDFSKDKFSTGAGGDLYGKGIYLTDNPEVASTYARRPTSSRSTEPRPALIQQLYSLQDTDPKTYETIRPFVDSWVTSTGPQYSAASTISAWHALDDEIRRLGIILNPGPNVRIQRLFSAKPFDVEDIPHPADARAIMDSLEQKLGPRTQPNDKDWGRLIPEFLNSTYKSLTGSGDYDSAAIQFLVNRHPEALQSAGFDSIRYPGGAVSGGQYHNAYVAPDPCQVLPQYPIQGEDALIELLMHERAKRAQGGQ
jgi:hypothetical protein